MGEENKAVDRSNEFSLLTPQEWDVYSHLSEAYNQFMELPSYFGGDLIDFTFHINALKSILMSRPVEREMSKRDWVGYNPIEKDDKGLNPFRDIAPIEQDDKSDLT